MKATRLLCLTVFISCSTLSLSLAEKRESQAGPSFAVFGRTVAFLTGESPGAASLRVQSPDGSVQDALFEPGETPYYDLPELALDGQYSFELRAVPTGELMTRSGEGESEPAMEYRDDPLLFSGSFQVIDGVVQESVTSEPGVQLDVVTADDSIVQGSLCVGFDCVNNETFGFSTILLKENSTRITFTDTSVGEFPATDWQLTANDSASGGLNKFSIEDLTSARVPFTVEGGATTNSFYLDSTGRIGLRTSTPVLDVHARTSNTPGWRLEQDSSGGFTSQTWDIAGNEANFFVRDVTSGSRLPFRIRPGAPTSSLDIAGNGFLGVGTGSPDFPIHVSRTGAAATLVFERTDGASGQLAANANAVLVGSRSNHDLRLITNSSNRITVSKTGFFGIGTTAPAHLIELSGGAYSDGGAWVDGSSRDLKDNISLLGADEAFTALRWLEPVKFTYKSEPGDDHVGFIAEDVPSLVATKDRKGLSAMDIVAVLTRVVQDQQKTIQSLESRLKLLEQRSTDKQ